MTTKTTKTTIKMTTMTTTTITTTISTTTTTTTTTTTSRKIANIEFFLAGDLRFCHFLPILNYLETKCFWHQVAERKPQTACGTGHRRKFRR